MVNKHRGELTRRITRWDANPREPTKSCLRGIETLPEQIILLPTHTISQRACVAIGGVNPKRAALCMAARFAYYFAQWRGIRYAHFVELPYLVCFRMESTMLVVFHPTISVATEDISTGILSAPHGLTAIIGSPIL